ncbi:hypothetical protein [Paraburkholderia sediminicola]
MTGTQRPQSLSEGRRIDKSRIIAEESQLAAPVCVGERFEGSGVEQ